jgi:L-amino acid N-acyltransferase YncA
MSLNLIPLTLSDLPIVKAVYDYYIVNTTATFHTELITLDELKTVIPIGQQKYPSFLINYNGQVCGYCYLSQYKKRQAYDRTAEITLYLKPGFTGKGIGKATLQLMETVAKNNDIKVLIGIISGENEDSIKLFEKCGYQKCAHFKQVGEKFGRLLDIVAYQKLTSR